MDSSISLAERLGERRETDYTQPTDTQIRGTKHHMPLEGTDYSLETKKSLTRKLFHLILHL